MQNNAKKETVHIRGTKVIPIGTRLGLTTQEQK
jgi:hypothetical protein